MWLCLHARMKWIAISRNTRQVLGFAFGKRDESTLALCWSDVPANYRNKPVFTDCFSLYPTFFSDKQHHPCEKGSGATSVAESLNTKWRQRVHACVNGQSGLVRRSCGVARRIETDLIERFFLLVEQHNQQSHRRPNPKQLTTQTDQ